jgi:hypothetical protein
MFSSLCRTALRATRAPRASTRGAVVVRAAVPPTPMGVRTTALKKKSLDSQWLVGSTQGRCRRRHVGICFTCYHDTTRTHSLPLLHSIAVVGNANWHWVASYSPPQGVIVGVCVQLPQPKRVPKNLEPRLVGACCSVLPRRPNLIPPLSRLAAACRPISCPKHTQPGVGVGVNVPRLTPASATVGASAHSTWRLEGVLRRLLRPGRDHQQPRGHDRSLCTVRARGGTAQPRIPPASPSCRRFRRNHTVRWTVLKCGWDHEFCWRRLRTLGFSTCWAWRPATVSTLGFREYCGREQGRRCHVSRG